MNPAKNFTVKECLPAVSSITHNKRYLPHELSTRINAVKLYAHTKDVSFVCRRYHISKASLMRWNKRYDGTRESLMDKSHRPLSPHPKSHTEEEIAWIVNLCRRNPHISAYELYGKLLEQKGYSRHPGSLFRVLRRLGIIERLPSTKKKRQPKPYATPSFLGVKWQLDVKYVPTACYVGKDGRKFYQYTMLEEASRKRFIYAYEEQSGYSTVDFICRAINYFGYKPEIIQTDNGSEFTNTAKTTRVHIMDSTCKKLGIEHKLIRPATPRHNGKVERSHRNDQERFYNSLKFYSLEDLQKQMSDYLYRSNRIPSRVLDWLSPVKLHKQLFAKKPLPRHPYLTPDPMLYVEKAAS